MNERLVGVALAATESSASGFSNRQHRELVAYHRDAMLWALTVERKLVFLADRLAGAGIDFVVLKGATLAHTVYPDPSWRSFGDLDLLVKATDWRTVHDHLGSLGFTRHMPEPRKGFDERFGKAAVLTNGDGIEVDLHRTLAMGAFGQWIGSDDLFRETAEMQLAGRTILRLNDTAAFLHACIHAILGWNPPQLWPLRDVLQLAHHGAVRWDHAAELSKRWRLRGVVHMALTTASESLGVALPEPAHRMLERERPGRREMAAMRAYLQPGGAGPLATIGAIRGIGARISYVSMLLFPSREFLAARQGTARGSYFDRWLSSLRRIRRKVREQP